MPKKLVRWLPLFSVLLLAAGLRLYRIGEYMTYLGDEGRDMLVVKRILVDHTFTLLGPITSVGSIYMGPAYYYLMTPFLWLFRFNPVGPSVMVALLSVATVYLIYRIGSEFFRPAAGVFASILYATSPLAIVYGRSSWNPNVVPFFATLTMYGILRTVVKKDYRFLILSGAALGILIQLHYVTFLFFPVVFLSLMLIRFKIPLRFAAYAVLAFILTYSPFLLFELRHGFVNTQGAINFITQSKDSTAFGWERFGLVISDVTTRVFWRLAVVHSAELTKAVLFAVAAFIIYFYRKNKADSKAGLALNVILIWLIGGVISFGVYQGVIYDYYFGSLFATPFLLIGLALSMLFYGGVFMRVVSLLILGLLLYFHAASSPLLISPNNLVKNTETIARFVSEKTEGKPYNFALIAGKNSDHAYRYFLELWGMPPVVVQPPAIDPKRESVTEQLLIVCEEKECKPLGHPLWEIAGFGPAEIVGEWPVSTARVMKLRRL